MATTKIYGSRYSEPWRGLPSELRNMIYELSVCNIGPITLCKDRRRRRRTLARDDGSLKLKYPLDTGILGTCRDANAVASKSLWTHNVVVFDAPCANILKWLSSHPARRSRIRRIRFSHYALRCDGGSTNADANGDTSASLERLLHLLIYQMSPQSITVPLWEEPGLVNDMWYRGLRRAVYLGRLPRLCFHHFLGRPDEANRSGLGSLSPLAGIYSQYWAAVGDTVEGDLERAYLDMALGFFVSDRPSRDRIKTIRFYLTDLVWQQRNFCPFRMALGQLEGGEKGLMAVLRYDPDGAKSWVEASEEKVRQGVEYDKEERALHPVSVMRFDERVSKARRSLQRHADLLEQDRNQ